jgi:acyl-CoA synthetase (AMP-forming)/AMP-acid ligase II
VASSSDPIAPAPRGRNPFGSEGVVRDPGGLARYVDRPRSLVTMLRAAVERRGAATAVVEVGGGRLSYAQLWERASRVAAGLRRRGIGAGDRVAIRLPNGLDWVLAFWGVQLAGAVAVPINVRLSDSEVDYQLRDSGAAFVFEPEVPFPDADPLEPADPAPDDLAAIFYTSGTTGFPKGAMTTHANFLTNSENAFRLLEVDRSEGPGIATLVSVPLFHVTGCNSQLIPILEVGGTVVILTRALAIESFLAAVAEHRVAHLVSVPAIYHVLVGHEAFGGADVSCVRWVFYGGAPIAESLVERLKRSFPAARVGNGFGLTETCSLTSFLPHADSTAHPRSVGFAMPVVDLAIDGPDPESGVGELLVRGPNVVAGYWQRPEETVATFRDGWLRTGDLARIEEDGLLYLVDRRKDMINRGGENVYSIEVENALAGAPGIGEAAVVGVPDSMMGEKVGAVLVPAAGARVEIDEVIAYARERLADFKVPQYAALRERPLPRNAGGKVLKPLLKEETEWGEALR